MPTGIYLRTSFHKKRISTGLKGRKHSLKTRRKMSERQRIKNFSFDDKNRYSKLRKESRKNKDINLSNKSQLEFRLTRKGRKWTDKEKEVLRQRMMGNRRPLGFKQSNETKKKRSLSLTGHRSWSKGRKVSEEERQKLSLAHRGKKMGAENPSWKGGITCATGKRLSRFEWKILAKKIYKRDNWICQDCGQKCNRKSGINAHHIIPFILGGTDNPNNLTTLDNKHHRIAEIQFQYLL